MTYRICVILSVGLCPCASYGQDTDSVLADLRTRASATEGVRYRITGTVKTPKGARNGEKDLFPVPIAGDVPPADYTYETRRVLLLDFRGNRCRYDYQGDVFGGLSPAFQKAREVKVFDGKQAQDYRPPSGNPELRQLEGVNLKSLKNENDRFFYDRVSQVLLIGHGFDPRAALLGSGNIRLREPPDLSQFEVAGERSLSDERLLALSASTSANSTLELWIDPLRESAVRRLQFRHKDQLTEDVVVRVSQTPCGWMPEEITIDSYGPRTGQLLKHEVARITECVCDPKWEGKDFVITPEPGSIVKTDSNAE